MIINYKEKKTIENENSEFLEKLYLGVVNIFMNNIYKIANMNNTESLTELSSLEDYISNLLIIKKNIKKQKKINYSFCSHEIKSWYHNYLVGNNI